MLHWHSTVLRASLAIWWLLSAVAQVSMAGDVPQSEYLALYELYNTTAGEHWFWGQYPGMQWTFNGASDPCADAWEGLLCTTQPGDEFSHVASIYLDGYNLDGYIPESIANITYLVDLTLRNNVLSAGVIPSSIGHLKYLEVLDLGSTGILAPIPEIFASMISLLYLDLSVNYITAEIPLSLCDARNLSQVILTENFFHGTLPGCFDQLTKLENLELDSNHLTGTLPAGLGRLDNLKVLIVGLNLFTGTIPETYAQLRRLQTLDISQNSLNGSLPASLGNYPDLSVLDFSVNQFTGPIPESFGKMSSIDSLTMKNNQLNGTIPESMCRLMSMSQFNVNENQLSGTLPRCWANFTEMEFLALYDNNFSGTIPPEWASLSLLREFALSSNRLSGTIPPNILLNMFQVAAFTVNDNVLTGPLPGDLFLHPGMETIAVSENRLTGTLPRMLTENSSVMLFASLAQNYLSGSLPEAIGHYHALIYLNLSTNSFTGSVPQSLCNLIILNYLYLGSNALTGTVPQCYGNLHALSYLYLDSNHLSGIIPPTFGQLALLQSMNLSSNHLSGRIPTTLSNLSNLEVLLLQDNALTGSLDGVFDSRALEMLATVQVSDNHLTGSLPDELFALASLQVFAAVSNCLTGTLPKVICQSGNLVTLALDGLLSAPSCQEKLFPSSLDGIVAPNLYTISSPITGGIPTCLFDMANLTTLHLSGNGLTGTLPADITISAALTDLSLSHNKLHGKIPAGFLSRHWMNLDLSYNRFTRSLSIDANSTFRAETSLSLEQNRLSGAIPSVLRDVVTISLLESNIFACNAEHSDLPRNDPDSDKYQCGSDTLDITMYAWTAFAGLAAVAMVALWKWRHSWDAQVLLIRKWWDASDLSVDLAARAEDLLHYTELRMAVVNVLRLTAVCTLYALCILLPLDAILCTVYSTYDHAYAWALSAAYLSGTVPFALLLVSLIGLAILLGAASAWLTTEGGGASARAITTAVIDVVQAVRWDRIMLYGTYVAVNFTIVLGVNIAYVIIALNQNGEALTLAQISLALFKVAFNGVCSPLLIRWTSHRVLKSGEEASTADLISIQLFVTLVNNIMIPCLVVAIISPSCFYNVFNAVSEVSSTFRYPGKCVAFDPVNGQFIVTCIGDETLTALTSYNPPFAYSYQCSSSFITYYAPAYVIMCIIASFVIPVGQLLLQRLHSRATKGTRWFALLDIVLPRILKPIYGVAPPSERSVFAPYFDATQHMITLLTYVGLLLTFGAVFPPLALCFAVTIVSIAVFTKLKVGRFLSQAVEFGVPQYLTVVNQECEGVGSTAILARSIYMMVVFSCLFYTLFLFDTLGDAVGLGRSYWVLIVVPLIPITQSVVYGLCQGDRLGWKGRSAPDIGLTDFPQRDSDMEMIVRSPLPNI